MANAEGTKEVRYDKWCELCKHAELEGYEDPCNECLEKFFNFETDKPVMFEAKDK